MLANDSVNEVQASDIVGNELNYTPHAPISITSNAQFSGNASAGNGTVWSPWIIKNYEINATGYSYGIRIEDTTDYFIIRDCYIHDVDSTGPTEICGIFTSNVVNGQRSNNNITNNAYCGIYLEVSNYNILVDNNTVYSNDAGIFAGASDNNTFENNNVFSNTWTGIEIYYSCKNNIIFGNTLTNNNLGCAVRGSGNTVWSNNFINNNNQAVSDDINAWDNGYPDGGTTGPITQATIRTQGPARIFQAATGLETNLIWT